MIAAGADLAIGGVAVSGLLVGLVTLARLLGVPSRFAPLVAVVLGVGFGVAAAAAGETIYLHGVVAGLYAGLAAVGLHATVSAAPSFTPSDSPRG